MAGVVLDLRMMVVAKLVGCSKETLCSRQKLGVFESKEKHFVMSLTMAVTAASLHGAHRSKYFRQYSNLELAKSTMRLMR